MALESTTCGIVHHARRTRAHCPTMVSSFKLSSGTVCLLGFSCRAGHIRKGKYKICGSYQVQDCTGRNGIVHHARRMTRCCNIYYNISGLIVLHLVGTTYLKNNLLEQLNSKTLFFNHRKWGKVGQYGTMRQNGTFK